MARELSRDVRCLVARKGRIEEVKTLLQSAPQPGSEDVLTERLVELAAASPEDGRPWSVPWLVMTLGLKIVVDELDRALRAGASVPE